MGLMDRVKEAAQEVAVEAKKVSAQAQGKLEETQLKRKMDDHAKALGYLVYKERTQGVVEGAEAERLVSEITSLELQIAKAAAATRLKQEAVQSSQSSGAAAAEPPPGGVVDLGPTGGTEPPPPGGASATPPPGPGSGPPPPAP